MTKLTNAQIGMIEADLLMETRTIVDLATELKCDNDDAERRAMMRRSAESEALEAQLSTPPVTERK